VAVEGVLSRSTVAEEGAVLSRSTVAEEGAVLSRSVEEAAAELQPSG
jgi:hypothetical protein